MCGRNQKRENLSLKIIIILNLLLHFDALFTVTAAVVVVVTVVVVVVVKAAESKVQNSNARQTGAEAEERRDDEVGDAHRCTATKLTLLPGVNVIKSP